MELSRPDGTPVIYVGLPLPIPRVGERYLPFGKEMVLVGDNLHQTGEAANLTLFWRTAAPLQSDYAVSVRLENADGTWLGMHDMQPGLGAFPTLKWVTRGDLIRDPHPIADLAAPPARFSVAVYERFRLTPLKSAYGDVATYSLR